MSKLNIPLKRSEREPSRTREAVNKRIVRWAIGFVAVALLAEAISHM